MKELLEYVLTSFWTFSGVAILITLIGNILVKLITTSIALLLDRDITFE